MKVFMVFAVILAVLGISLADEHKAENLAYWKCISCHEEETPRTEFLNCYESKPEKCKTAVEACKHKIMPDATTDDLVFKSVCKDEDNAAEKLYDCILSDEHTELSESEREVMKEIVCCAREENKNFCDAQ